MPGFVDAHARAFPYIALGLEGESEEDRYHRCQKMSLIHNDKIANQVFRKYVVSISDGHNYKYSYCQLEYSFCYYQLDYQLVYMYIG